MLGQMVVLFSVFEKHPYYFQQWLYQLTFPPTVYEGSLFFTSLPTFVICVLFDESHAEGDFKIVLINIQNLLIRSDQISRSVVSDSLRPHESQHARPLINK